MDESPPTPEVKQRAGQQEILGETLAKFEFFQRGWHPYSRFPDVDRVDLVLRRRHGNTIYYRDVQVKFGKLYRCGRSWEKPFFALTSWRFFPDSDLNKILQNPHLYLTYVLLADNARIPHIFLFRAPEFVDIIKRSDKRPKDRYCVCISMARGSDKCWYVRRLPKFEDLSDTSVIDVSKHYENFEVLEELKVQQMEVMP